MAETQAFADGGALYAETDFSRPIVEPWNAVTAAAFVVIAWLWLVRRRGFLRVRPLFAGLVGLVGLGGVGGILYHGLRSRYVYMLLDVVPIFLVAILLSAHFWRRLLPERARFAAPGIPVAVVAVALPFYFTSSHASIQFAYALIGVSTLAPIGLEAWRAGFHKGGLLGTALACFAVGFLFRSLDLSLAAWLPWGSHWLWHLCGAAGAGLLLEYAYARAEPLAAAPRAEVKLAPRFSAVNQEDDSAA